MCVVSLGLSYQSIYQEISNKLTNCARRARNTNIVLHNWTYGNYCVSQEWAHIFQANADYSEYALTSDSNCVRFYCKLILNSAFGNRHNFQMRFWSKINIVVIFVILFLISLKAEKQNKECTEWQYLSNTKPPIFLGNI